MRKYTFEIICQDGQPRTFTCQAQNFNQARTMLEQFRMSQPTAEPVPVANTTHVNTVVRSSGSVSYF